MWPENDLLFTLSVYSEYDCICGHHQQLPITNSDRALEALLCGQWDGSRRNETGHYMSKDATSFQYMK